MSEALSTEQKGVINMWKLKNSIFRLANPKFWGQLRETDWSWDRDLNACIDNVLSGEMSIEVSGRKLHFLHKGERKKQVWVGSYPYAFTDSLVLRG